MENILRKHFNNFDYTIAISDTIISDQYIDIPLNSRSCLLAGRKHPHVVNPNHISVSKDKLALKCSYAKCQGNDISKNITPEEYDTIRHDVLKRGVPHITQNNTDVNVIPVTKTCVNTDINNANQTNNKADIKADYNTTDTTKPKNFIYILIPDITQAHSREIKIGKTSYVCDIFSGYSKSDFYLLYDILKCTI